MNKVKLVEKFESLSKFVTLAGSDKYFFDNEDEAVAKAKELSEEYNGLPVPVYSLVKAVASTPGAMTTVAFPETIIWTS